MLKINPMITERRRLRSSFIGLSPPIKKFINGGNNIPRCFDLMIPDKQKVSNGFTKNNQKNRLCHFFWGLAHPERQVAVRSFGENIIMVGSVPASEYDYVLTLRIRLYATRSESFMSTDRWGLILS
jgi:hypothetical protein